MGLIYMATSKATGKSYIGQTTQALHKRQSQHKSQSWSLGTRSAFPNALRKHGFRDFIWKILEDNIQDIDTLNDREIFWIEFHDTYTSGYNSDHGGGNHNNREISEETRKKFTENGKNIYNTKTGIFKQEDHKGSNNGMYGKKHSEETKEKISLSHKNRDLEKQKLKNDRISKANTKFIYSYLRGDIRGDYWQDIENINIFCGSINLTRQAVDYGIRNEQPVKQIYFKRRLSLAL